MDISYVDLFTNLERETFYERKTVSDINGCQYGLRFHG